MINKIKVLAADVDMTLSSKSSPLPEITIQALQELHNRGIKRNIRLPLQKSCLIPVRLTVSYQIDLHVFVSS